MMKPQEPSMVPAAMATHELDKCGTGCRKNVAIDRRCNRPPFMLGWPHKTVAIGIALNSLD
jgi:hypothetical protein